MKRSKPCKQTKYILQEYEGTKDIYTCDICNHEIKTSVYKCDFCHDGDYCNVCILKLELRDKYFNCCQKCHEKFKPKLDEIASLEERANVMLEEIEQLAIFKD